MRAPLLDACRIASIALVSPSDRPAGQAEAGFDRPSCILAQVLAQSAAGEEHADREAGFGVSAGRFSG